MIKLAVTHPWEVTPKEALEIQRDLKERVVLIEGSKDIALVAGADVAYDRLRNRMWAAVVVLSYPQLEVVEETAVWKRVTFPYIPGYLTFREGPALIAAFKELQVQPDLILFDGQGIAHPRGLGLASHIGVLLERPSVGCAKSKLVGEYEEPDLPGGSWTPLRYQGRQVGTVVRTRDNVRPLFVSPGHLMGFASSTKVVLSCCQGYRLPEPTRMADRLSREAKGGI